jgi:putative flavoprotein involved in K+ transport
MSLGRTVIIGAGPAGLATAAQLARQGIPTVVLERGDGVAHSWRGRYDRLRLNSSRWFSALPGAAFGRATGVFPARDDVVRYLESYAHRHELDVRLRTTVERIDRDGEGFVVRTSSGDVAASQVVVATGYAHSGRVPAWPGR